MSDRAKDAGEKKHANPATRTEPAEEFIDAVNRPSVPESEAAESKETAREHKPPNQNG